ncbi:MAG: AAA family ATPase [Lachnospiraceae bacterium]|nr:AAA family ATPase [Lachnospiraceae bacterium]
MVKFEVKDLYLEGFAKIQTGMHIDRVYLDFEKMLYQTYLFVGDSGSGKTSILKCIHPFAFNSGTGDDTANGKMIIANRSGRKIIRYFMDKDIITCKHIYMRKPDDSIQIKSFFMVNDKELNPTGLVTTFREYVQQYFQIDESFLTLLALGNSVRGLVDFTSGERKKLAVRIFTELNVYMSYYKNATAAVRDLNSVLNNVVDKLGQYGGYDKGQLKKEISTIGSMIQNLEVELNAILKEEGGLKTNLEINQEAYSEYETWQDTLTKLLAEVESLKAKRKTASDLVVLDNEKNQITKNIIQTQLRIESLESTIKSELDFKEMKLSSQKSLEDCISRTENKTNQTELEKLLANIDAELVGLEDIDVKPGIDYLAKKEELVRANIYLDELRGLCTDLVTEVRDVDLVADVLKKFLGNKNFEREVDITYQAAIERIANLQNANQLSGKITIPSIRFDNCKTKGCPYRKFYEDSVDILQAKKGEADKILRIEEEHLHIAEDRRMIFLVLKKLYGYINKHNAELRGVPKEIFDPETFVTKFLNGDDRLVYNVGLMSNTISYLEQAVRKSELLTLQKTTKDQLAGLESTIALFESMKIDLERTNQAIAETDEVITHHQNDLEYNKEQLKELNATVKHLDDEIEIAKELEDKRSQIKETQKKLSSMEDCKKKYDSLSSQLRDLIEKESNLQEELKSQRSQLNRAKNTLETIQSLESEKEVLSSRYSKAVLIRDAVSPSKGIPVEFIEDVIRNQMIDSVNELMHVAYPDITLVKTEREGLIIDDKEFTLPYRKNGTIVGDISGASDGERAMLSMCFSLVLIRLVSKVYNIMLLDEMDTRLDKHGRSKFIDIIERYMKTIHATQVFLISHNSMFDMYNVNVLQTTTGSMDTKEGKCITRVFEQNLTPDEYKIVS